MASTSGVGLPPRAGGPPRESTCGRFMKEIESAAKHFLARRLEERLINDYVVLQTTARKLATGVAYLSLTWSTVVLLGGFVSLLKLIDFWFLTAISTSFAVNLADLFESTTEYLLAAANVYIGLRDDVVREFSVSSCVGVLAEACFGVLIFAASTVTQVLTIAPLVAIVLSLVRLVVNSYGSVDGDAPNAAKLKASLQIFYSLAVVQSTLFYFFKMLILTEQQRASAVSREYGFGKWGTILVMRYLRETRTVCATEGHLPQGRNLIIFAVKLLGSESMDDRCSAVRLLDTFVGKQIPVGPNLLPCKDRLENLMEVLEVGDGESREHAARIVVALAGDLCHIDQFPIALYHIASLLQASEQRHGQAYDKFPTTTGTKTSMRWWNVPIYWGILSYFRIPKLLEEKYKQEDVLPYSKPKQLICQGLLIIERLSLHEGNCVHICNNHGLLSKIMAPLNSHAFLDAEYDSEWTDILSRSLRIVARLIKAPGEACRGLRNGIASKTRPVANLTRILEQDDKFGPALKASAIEILAELASDKPVTSLDKDGIKKFISQLWGIFFLADEMDGNDNTIEEEKDQEANRLMRQKAGEALARMLAVWNAPGISSSDILEMFIQCTGSAEAPTAELLRHVVGQLTDILTTKRGSRTRAAEILVHLCSHFTKYTELPRQDVIKMLTKVLQLIIQCIPREPNNNATAGVGANNNHAAQNDVENPRPAPGKDTGNGSSRKEYEQQQEEKDFVVALLSLALVICDRMVDAQDFTCAASGDMVVLLVTKLKEIIETNNDTTVECLSAVKLSCQLIVSMVELQPSSIKVFMEHNFKHVLSGSLKSLSNLDNCMLFDAEYHQVTKTDKPLASLVKQAQECFDRAQELGSSLGNGGPA